MVEIAILQATLKPLIQRVSRGEILCKTLTCGQPGFAQWG